MHKSLQCRSDMAAPKVLLVRKQGPHRGPCARLHQQTGKLV
jgi:hypothetical protein